MTGAGGPARPIVDWGWAGQALELISGDAHVVAPFCGGALVALIDGLGHGPAAAAAAAAAVEELEAHPDDTVDRLVQRCHEALRRTRGAVMTLASFRAVDASLTWLGIGNVAGVLLRDRGAPRARHDAPLDATHHAHHRIPREAAHAIAHGPTNEALDTRGGVVGCRVPSLRVRTLRLAPGDTMILATDGVRGGFSTHLEATDAPQELAESILARFRHGRDDAHVVVARYLGGDA